MLHRAPSALLLGAVRGWAAMLLLASGFVWGSAPTRPGAPPAPSSVSVTGQSADGRSYTVSWTASQDAEDYELQERLGDGGWRRRYYGPSRSRGFSGQEPGTYQYQVQACKRESVFPDYITWPTIQLCPFQHGRDHNSPLLTAGHSDCGEKVSRTTCGRWAMSDSIVVPSSPPPPPPCTPPDAPEITGPLRSPTHDFVLEWGPVLGATRYELQQRFGNGRWSTVSTTTALTFSASVTADGVWGYQAKSCNSRCCGGWSREHRVDVMEMMVPPELSIRPDRNTVTESPAFGESWKNDDAGRSG